MYYHAFELTELIEQIELIESIWQKEFEGGWIKTKLECVIVK